MGFFYEGHTPKEVLNDPAEDADRKRRGYLGDHHGSEDNNDTILSGDVNQRGSPDWTPDGGTGEGYDIVGGWRRPGTSAFDKDVERARRMGAEGQRRGAPFVDQTQAGQSRELEMNALGMLRAQGAGTAPSAAQTLSQRVNQNAVQNAGQQMTAARGIGSRIASAQGAGQQAGQAMLAGNAANAASRAGEISQGQTAYSASASGARGQDIGYATADAQFEAQQRALNEARQQRFERMGWDTRKTQQQAEDDWKRMSDDQKIAIAQQQEAARGRDDATTLGAINLATAGGSGLATGTGSDERMKAHVRPMAMGSLSSLFHGRA